jgi:hypothetical protein
MTESITNGVAVPSVLDAPAPPAPSSTIRRHTLAPKQQQFFIRQKQSLTNLEMGLRGALQLLVEERGLVGKVSLAEDCLELIEEPEATP